MNNAMNAVIYARYSSHSQNERSIDGQLQDCYEYAKRCGYTVIDEYIDKALTGTNDARPGFQKMIADAKKKQFQYVLVYKLDRFARNRYDSAIYKSQLKKYGIRIVSAMEQLSDSPESIILESVLEGMAEYYSANLSQNVKRGQRVALQNKTFTGGRPPYGYKINNKVPELDEKTAPVARWIFEQYADGVTRKEIIQSLNAKGIKSHTGASFTVNSLQHMLSNKKYIGIHVYGDEEIEGIWPPIIDEELFERVQKRIAEAKRAPAAAKAKVRYSLQGKLFCGHCGANMVGDSGKNRHGTVYNYYACNSRKKKLKDCDKKREKKDFIEWYVVEQTLQYILAPERVNYVAERVVKAYNDEFDDRKIKEVEKRIKQINIEIDKTVQSAINTTLDKLRAKIEEQAEKLFTEKEDLEISLSKLKIANKVQLTKEDVLKWLKSFCNGDLLDEEFRQKIIDTFINAVYLFDDKVVLYYNIKDSKQVAYIDMLEDLEESTEENKKEEHSLECSSNVRILNPLAEREGFEPSERY